MKAPVFILGSHKSGTSLLRNLFDGAADLFVLPIESHFFQCTGQWVDYPFRRVWPESLPLKRIYENFSSLIYKSHTQTSSTGDSNLKGWWDLELFSKTLKSGPSRVPETLEERRALMEHYIKALHLGLYRYPITTKRFLEKSVEHAEFASILQGMYPDAVFIHVVRNPYATLLAIRRHMSGQRFPFLAKALGALYNSYYFLYKNPLLIRNYRQVRYEDLVSDTETVMRSLTEFAGIPFSETLLTPTVMGKPWEGNSTGGRRFSGISQDPVNAWKPDISSLEVHFINRFFLHVLRDYHYEFLTPKKTICAPVPSEGPKTYLLNRMLWTITCRTNLFH